MPDSANTSMNTCQQSLESFYSDLKETGLIRRLLEIARDEDIGPSRLDLTAAACGSDSQKTTARIIAGSDTVIAGLIVIPELLDVFGAQIQVSTELGDAQHALAGQTVAELTGPLDQIVTVERTILNLVGRLSGIATLTQEFVSRAGSGVLVLDTRKTTPGLRVLEKYAVRCGGGTSHRMGLADAVLIKDNHISHVPLDELIAWLSHAAGRALARTCRFVEVEVDTLEQFEQVLRVETGLIDYVLLDNMDTATMRRAVTMRDAGKSTIKLEASGGVNLETIAGIAATGVDRISVGAMTHRAVTADVRLDIEPRS